MKKDDIYSSTGTEVESSTTADNLQVSPPIANTLLAEVEGVKTETK